MEQGVPNNETYWAQYRIMMTAKSNIYNDV